MNLHTVTHGLFKLDGGAMFGVVPKPLWSKHHPTDERNRCDWALRSLLIENGDRLMLVDCGMGDKQGEKFFGHYAPRNEDLDLQLDALGFHRGDITDVFLTHLHFDHCGGAIDAERTTPSGLNPPLPTPRSGAPNATGPGPTTPTRGKRPASSKRTSTRSRPQDSSNSSPR